MSKALRRAAWGLTAGLVMASPALAQYAAHLPGQSAPATPRVATVMQAQPASGIVVPVAMTAPTIATPTYYTPAVPKGYVLQPVSHTISVITMAGQPAGYVLQAVDGQPVTTPVLDSHTKLEEMKVELALCSDPATFACNLTAKLDGQSMLVRGFVPNESVREKAIQIARTGTHLAVADGLKIHRSLVMRGAGVPTDTLQEGARELLTEGFPEAAQGIEVKATIIGQITLSGSARSFEEKLAVSQRLRRLNGCTAVVNQLKVTPLMKDGMSLTLVTADGLHVVPAEFAMDAPMEATVLAIPAVRVVSPVQGMATINPLEVPAVAPSSPTIMEAPPLPRSLPSALPARVPSGAADVTQGVVTFGDETEAKPQLKKK